MKTAHRLFLYPPTTTTRVCLFSYLFVFDIINEITLIIIKAILVLPAKMKLWPQGKLVNDWVLRSQNHCAWVCCRWPCYRAWSLLSPSWAGSGEPGDKDDKKAINQTKPKVPILYLQSTDLYKKKLQITLFLFSSEEITGIPN